MRTVISVVVAACSMLAALPSAGQESDRDRDRDRDTERLPIRDPSRVLPSRADGQSVLGGREAFDRGPQFQINRRERKTEPAPDAAGAQLAGQAQTLSYECDIGERVELVGADNIVTISGQCLGLNIVGNGNQIDIEVVDDIRIQGDGNDIRWGRGFTLARPEVMQLEGSNNARSRR